MGKHFRGTDQPSIHHQITGKNPTELIDGPHYCKDKTRCRRHNGRLHLAFLHGAQGETKTAEANKNVASIKENDFPLLNRKRLSIGTSQNVVANHWGNYYGDPSLG